MSNQSDTPAPEAAPEQALAVNVPNGLAHSPILDAVRAINDSSSLAAIQKMLAEASAWHTGLAPFQELVKSQVDQIRLSLAPLQAQMKLSAEPPLRLFETFRAADIRPGYDFPAPIPPPRRDLARIEELEHEVRMLRAEQDARHEADTELRMRVVHIQNKVDQMSRWLDPDAAGPTTQDHEPQ